MDADNVTVTAIKCSEDADTRAIVRLLETEGTETTAHMTLLGGSIEAKLTPYAVRTVDENGTALNFMEWEMEE